MLFKILFEVDCVPRECRRALVVPNFKKGDKEVALSYRHVLLTSVDCTVLGKIYMEQIEDFFGWQERTR